jgi:L-histidine Nalpha-methyltransferase
MQSGSVLLEAPRAGSSAEDFAHNVQAGLSRPQKSLSSAYFYDARGSQLFQQITRQPEYYLTRCEREILEQHSGDIARCLAGRPCRVVEIGAGDGHKTEILLQKLLDLELVEEYAPIDICRQAIVELTSNLRRKLSAPKMRLRGIVAEYFDAFPLLRQKPNVRNLVLFLGSSIGNFGPRGARRLLRGLQRSLSPGDLIVIGFDLKKDIDLLRQAYDDAAGVTREFNFNLLDRINGELGGQFERTRFLHHAAYNLRLGCMESWLVSNRRQRVPIASLPMTATFEPWEGVRVERSYKYDLDQIEDLGSTTGWQVKEHFFDRRGYFADSVWIVAGN